jgi:hypothetical protein
MNSENIFREAAELQNLSAKEPEMFDLTERYLARTAMLQRLLDLDDLGHWVGEVARTEIARVLEPKGYPAPPELVSEFREPVHEQDE